MHKFVLAFRFLALFISCLFTDNINYSQCQSFQQSKKIVAFDRWSDDYFGSALAISGDYAIVGANRDSKGVLLGSISTHNAGSAYIYERDSSGNWNMAQKIIASDRRHNDNFGTSVSISGNYAIVAARANDEDTAGGNFLYHSGSAYIYERDSAGVWVEVQKLVASDRAREDFFGTSVSISGDYVFVGAPEEDEDSTGANTMLRAGSCYVFERDSSGVWHQVQKLNASDRTAYNGFAGSVSVSGNYGIVSSSNSYDTSGNYLAYSGACYMFERQSSGVWTEVQKIFPAYRVSNLNFGYALSLSGNKLVVSSLAYIDSTEPSGSFGQGACFIFEQDTSGIWQETQIIDASDKSNGDYFGSSVSISGDYIIVGAPQEDEDDYGKDSIRDAGSSYLFKKDTNGNWVEQYKLVASDRGFGDRFGWSCAIDGNSILIGTIYDEKDENGLNPITSAGSAYIYGLAPTVYRDSISHIVCDTFTSPSGKKWKGTATYYDTIQTLLGCDSIIKFDLIFGLALVNNNPQVTTCDSAKIGASWYFISQIVKDTFLGVTCDSISITNLIIKNSAYDTLPSITACDSAQINGVWYYSSQTIFNTIVAGATNGCDSVLVTNLVINNSFSDTQVVSSCGSYTSPNSKIWSSSGTYFDTLISVLGCDSVISYNLTINSVSNFVSVTGITLSATQLGATYQWLDCDSNKTKILGEINPVFLPFQNGNYAVEISKNGCVDTSACISINSVGYFENNLASSIILFPNPSNSFLTVSTSKKINNLEITMFNSAGKKVLSSNMNYLEKSTLIDVSQLKNGVYLFKINCEEGVIKKRIVIVD